MEPLILVCTAASSPQSLDTRKTRRSHCVSSFFRPGGGGKRGDNAATSTSYSIVISGPQKGSLQSRLGDKPLQFQVVCPQNGTAVLTQRTRIRVFSPGDEESFRAGQWHRSSRSLCRAICKKRNITHACHASSARAKSARLPRYGSVAPLLPPLVPGHLHE